MGCDGTSPNELDRDEDAVNEFELAARLTPAAVEPASLAYRPMPEPPRVEPGQVSFTLQFRDEVSPYRLMSLFAMPGERVDLEALLTAGPARATAEAGALESTGPSKWAWTAPDEPGLVRLQIADPRAGETMTLHAFVLVPFDHQSEAIDGYALGRYEPEKHNPRRIYQQPPGFVRVTEELADTQLTPHFTLRPFLCKQGSGWPRYAIVNERLLLKLELLLHELNEEGIAADSLAFVSGFRTPRYNATIGNRTKHSAHLYGAAADIYVDTDGDGRMDDLDGDGDVDRRDAEWFAALVEGLGDEPHYRPFIGGLGIYGPKPHRGPFIHVDVRGTRARW